MARPGLWVMEFFLVNGYGAGVEAPVPVSGEVLAQASADRQQSTGSRCGVARQASLGVPNAGNSVRGGPQATPCLRSSGITGQETTITTRATNADTRMVRKDWTWNHENDTARTMDPILKLRGGGDEERETEEEVRRGKDDIPVSSRPKTGLGGGGEQSLLSCFLVRSNSLPSSSRHAKRKTVSRLDAGESGDSEVPDATVEALAEEKQRVGDALNRMKEFILQHNNVHTGVNSIPTDLGKAFYKAEEHLKHVLDARGRREGQVCTLLGRVAELEATVR